MVPLAPLLFYRGAASKIVQYCPVRATPISVACGFIILAQCPGLSIQALTTLSSLGCPIATFSAQIRH